MTSKMLRWCDDGMHWMDMGALPCNIYENRRQLADAPTRPPSCVARWERGGFAALRCHSRKWESAVCGALVGTLSNKKEFPTTTSSGVVADHREGVFLQD